jgi:hypothetical protein
MTKVTDKKITELGNQLKAAILDKANEVSKGNTSLLLLNLLMISIGVAKNLLNVDEHLMKVTEEIEKEMKEAK